MVVLAVAEQAPGKLCDVTADPFQQLPQKRRDYDSPGESSAIAKQSRKEQEQCPEKAEREAKQEQNPDTEDGADAGVMLNDIVNPVQVSNIKQESAEKTEEKQTAPVFRFEL